MLAMSLVLQVIGVIYRQFSVLESMSSAENIDVSFVTSFLIRKMPLSLDIEG